MAYGAILGQNNYVKRTGDIMTGPLVLPGDPTENLQAVTKQYVDTTVSSFTNNYKQNLIVSVTLNKNISTENFRVPNIITLNGKQPIGALFSFICNNITFKHYEMCYIDFPTWRWPVFNAEGTGPTFVEVNGEYNFIQYFYFYGRDRDGEIGYGGVPFQGSNIKLVMISPNSQYTLSTDADLSGSKSIIFNYYLFY